MNLLKYILLLFIIVVFVTCKKYERNTLYFTPPESIMCGRDIDFWLEGYTINGNSYNLGYNIRIYLRNSPSKYMALYENATRVYELDDDDFSCYSDSDYFPLSPIKIKGNYSKSNKWKIIYLDKRKIELKYIDDQGNVHIMSFKITVVKK